MAESHPKKPRLPAPRLYLVTPPVEDAAAFTPLLRAALDAADIAALLLQLAAADERSQINCIKTLVPVVQERGIALLVDGHVDLVARGGADGAHLTGIESFLPALETLKPDRIAGCGGLASRHDAMTAAERGADYVMFGDAANGRRPSFGAVLERVGWWSEVFEVPCVAFAETLDEVAPLAAAGADFVAAGDFIWADERGAASALSAAEKALATTKAVA
jgi:thiamine-phosphate pyrophosphorylase